MKFDLTFIVKSIDQDGEWLVGWKKVASLPRTDIEFHYMLFMLVEITLSYKKESIEITDFRLVK